MMAGIRGYTYLIIRSNTTITKSKTARPTEPITIVGIKLSKLIPKLLPASSLGV
jgi:hypothetical protein